MRIAKPPVVAAFLIAFAAPPRASSETVVYAFGPPYRGNPPATGGGPVAGLLPADGGRIFYGGASNGGVAPGGGSKSADCGTIFKLRKVYVAGGSSYTVLHSLVPATEGCEPLGALVSDGKSVFGTTETMGPGGAGAVFQLALPTKSNPVATLQVLHAFGGTGDGATPIAGLYRSASGTLYGTTSYGGTSNLGTVFQLLPPAPGAQGWQYSVIYNFQPGTGYYPQASLIADAAGNLYGTTVNGGFFHEGTVFELSPQQLPGGAWTETSIDEFGYLQDGPRTLMSALIFDAQGNLYGTSKHGGIVNGGTVYELSPPSAPGGRWTDQVLYSFSSVFGSTPTAPLIMGANGILYGTTERGGNYSGGTVFSLTPPTDQGMPWTESILNSFVMAPGNAGGNRPRGGLAFTSKGDLIGTTAYGGSYNYGVIFTVPTTPPAD